MLQLFQRLFGRTKSQLPPFDFARNRYPAKKHWPPNLRTLTEKQQFRFERKFKRRLRLKSIKPQWIKWIKIVQWSMISFVVFYGVLFHDWSNDPMNPRQGQQPFKGLREKMWAFYEGLWTHTTSDPRTGATQSQTPAPMATLQDVEPGRTAAGGRTVGEEVEGGRAAAENVAAEMAGPRTKPAGGAKTWVEQWREQQHRPLGRRDP